MLSRNRCHRHNAIQYRRVFRRMADDETRMSSVFSIESRTIISINNVYTCYMHVVQFSRS